MSSDRGKQVARSSSTSEPIPFPGEALAGSLTKLLAEDLEDLPVQDFEDKLQEIDDAELAAAGEAGNIRIQ